MEENKVYLGDCLELMKEIPDKSVDMILCDLPYGTTKIKWDIIIDFDMLWEQYFRISKDNCAICLFSSQPFTTDLINSNRKWFRYEIIWNKLHGTDFQMANSKPMKSHENICIFYQNKPTYNPQFEDRDKVLDTSNWKLDKRAGNHQNFSSKEDIKKIYDRKFPTTVLNYSMSNGECNNSRRLHPTQKPEFVCEWLIKTYTNEGDLVLDNCAGSGTTGIACINTNRKYILMEKEEKYYEIIQDRIKNHLPTKYLNNDFF